MAANLKRKALEVSLCGTWLGSVVDQETRTVVKEIFSQHGAYFSEIRHPRTDGVDNHLMWGLWRATKTDVFVELQGSSDPSLVELGDQIVMRDVVIVGFVMTYRDPTGTPWVHLRISE
jgi:hypothetical protein